MDPQTPENKALPELETEAVVQELLRTQLELGQSISSTSQFLRFVLTLANENLGVIRAQLEAIRDLASEIDDREQAS